MTFLKSLGHCSPVGGRRFEFIQTLHDEHPLMNLTEACITLNVSRSGYHAHLSKHHPPHRRQDAQLANGIPAAI